MTYFLIILVETGLLNNTFCGIVVGVVEQIDAGALTAQFDSFFELYRQLVTQRYGAYNEGITGLENTANTDYQAFVNLLNQLRAENEQDFNIWFSGIQDLFSGDVAGNFALQIGDLQNRVAELEGIISNLPTFTMEAWLGYSYSGCAYLSTM